MWQKAACILIKTKRTQPVRANGVKQGQSFAAKVKDIYVGMSKKAMTYDLLVVSSKAKYSLVGNLM